MLIVEDEPVIAADLSLQLRKLGFHVIADVESGQEALSIIDNTQPDIILMDIRLSGKLDGIETALTIKKKASIPIIFVTSNTDDITFDRAREVNPVAFLSKPFRAADIARSIELALNVSNELVEDVLEDQLEQVLDDRIFVRDKLYLHKILIENILYVEADSSYCRIVTDKKTFVTPHTLKHFDAIIHNNKLTRVHRKFIINLLKVDRISEGYLHIGSMAIPVGRSYKNEVVSRFKSL